MHVIFGSFVLVVAPAAMLARKGGRWHRRTGRAFMFAMSIVLFTAGFMWQPKGHVFLLALALVSAYLVFNGFRLVLRRRRRRGDVLDDGIDIAAAGMTVACGVWLLTISATAKGELMRSLAPIMAGLGIMAVAFAFNDVRGVLGPRSRAGWLIAHFSAMIAAYISAVTAFVVINAHGVPMQWRWIVPISIGSLVISGFSLPHRLPKSMKLRLGALFTGTKSSLPPARAERPAARAGVLETAQRAAPSMSNDAADATANLS